MFVYTGCRTTKERNARGEGIEVYKIDENDNWNVEGNKAKILIKNFKPGDVKEYHLKIFRNGDKDVSDLVNNDVPILAHQF